MGDLKLIENGSGGDFVLIGNDLKFVTGFQNMPYISMFGGNKEQSTKEFLPNEERFDYWANELLMLQSPETQYNSNLERLLERIAITSSSVLEVEDTIKVDLSDMTEFSNIECEVYAEAIDRLRIEIKINQPDSLESPVFIYLWDVTKNELILCSDSDVTSSSSSVIPIGNVPIASLTSSKFSDGFKQLEYSGTFSLKDYLGNSLQVGDSLVIEVNTLSSGTYIGKGTFAYNGVFQTDLPVSSDAGFDNYILPFLTGQATDGGTYIFDKYGAVSFWNQTNGTLAGIDAGEDWVITIKAVDTSEGVASVNTDNFASFDKSKRCRVGSLLISARSGTIWAYGLGFNISTPNEGLVWNSDITYTLNGVPQPDVSLGQYILSNARSEYTLLTGAGSTLRDYLVSGNATNWPDFQLPGLFSEKLTQVSSGFNYGGNLSGIINYTPDKNNVSVQFSFGNRDAANQADEWEIYLSDVPNQDPLLGTKEVSVLNPPDPITRNVTRVFSQEGKYRFLTRNVDGSGITAYGDHEVLIFSI